MITLTHDYWPMTAPQDYLAYGITGVFHPDTHMLDVKTATRLPQSDHRRTYIPLLDCPMPATAIVYTALGQPAPPDWRDSCYSLVQSIAAAPGGKGLIGEGGGFADYFAPGTTPNRNCHVISQPEAQLPLDVTEYMQPVDGQCSGTSWNKDTGAATAISCPWRFRNLGPGPGPNGTWWWPQFANQLRTCLMERPDTFENESVYNYQFAKGTGLLCAWWIVRQRDNTGSGYMFQLAH